MLTFYNALHHFTGSKVNHNFPQHTHIHTHDDSACTQFCWWHRVVNHGDERTLAVERRSSMYHKDDWKCRESGSLLLLPVLTGNRSDAVAQLSRNHRGQRSDHGACTTRRSSITCFMCYPFSSFVMTWGDWRPRCRSIPRSKRAPCLIYKHTWKY